MLPSICRTLVDSSLRVDVRCCSHVKDGRPNLQGWMAAEKAYASCFREGVVPARVCVGGAQIVFDFRVEISVIAHKEENYSGLPRAL